MMTQENYRAPGYTVRQKRVTLNGVRVWADPEMIPLLKALNAAGLVTRSHCVGHETGRPWVAIRTDNIERIEVRKGRGYNEVVLMWKPK